MIKFNHKKYRCIIIINHHTLNTNNMSIKFNSDIVAAKTIEATFGTPQSYSKVAITIIDPQNVKLQIDMSFESTFDLEACFHHMLGTWFKYKPIKVFIRSYKTKDGYQDKFAGFKLSDSTPFPDKIEHFYYDGKCHDVIMDIDHIDKNLNAYKISLYRWRELVPRVLVFDLSKTALIETKDDY